MYAACLRLASRIGNKTRIRKVCGEIPWRAAGGLSYEDLNWGGLAGDAHCLCGQILRGSSMQIL
jgi:hypothetical protein